MPNIESTGAPLRGAHFFERKRYAMLNIMSNANIIDGRKTRDALLPELTEKIKTLLKPPTLAIIQVGNRDDSNSFIKAKKSFAAKIGVLERHIQLLESISTAELVKVVQECNADKNIQGIIVQLPLPIGIDRDSVIDAIDPRKDADGLTAKNVKAWLEGREDATMPATARGIKELLAFNGIDLFGKKVTIIGRSMLVGKPIAMMCLNENATVTVCHSKSENLANETKSADIIISAAGKSKLIGKDHVKAGQIVIDVGISRGVEGKLTGDVDFDVVKDVVAAISPVPGGVGPMTVLGLFQNLVDLCRTSF